MGKDELTWSGVLDDEDEAAACGWLVHWLGNASFFRSVLLRFLSWSWFLFSLGSLSKILDLFSSCSVFIFFSVCPSSSSQFVLPDSPSSSVYLFLCSFPCSSSVCSRSGATRDKAGARALAGQCFSLFLSRLLLQSSPGFFLRSSPSCFCVFLVLSLLFLEAGIEERWSRWWCGVLVLSVFFFIRPPLFFVAFSGLYKAREWLLFVHSCLTIVRHVHLCFSEKKRRSIRLVINFVAPEIATWG